MIDGIVPDGQSLAARQQSRDSGAEGNSYAYTDDGFNNVLEVQATPRPNLLMPGFERTQGHVSERSEGYLDDERHYKTINGKLGIFAELAELK